MEQEPTVTHKHNSSCRFNNALQQGCAPPWWHVVSPSLCLPSSWMLPLWVVTRHFFTNQTVRVFKPNSYFNVCHRWFKKKKKIQQHLWAVWVFHEVLTSRRNRGLSGMKTSPTSAARAGNRHTNMNNLQLCIWNSEPMAKPQPEKSDRAQTVRWNPFKWHSTSFKSLSVRFSFVHSCVRPIHLICVLNNRKKWLKIHFASAF